MELPDSSPANRIFGARLIDAIEKVQRLRASHDALLVALRWCASHDGECLADHPEVMAKLRAVIEQAEGSRIKTASASKLLAALKRLVGAVHEPIVFDCDPGVAEELERSIAVARAVIEQAEGG